MYFLIIMLPLLSSFFVGFFGRFLGLSGAALVGPFCIGLASVLSFFIIFEVAFCESCCYLKIGEWFQSGLFDAGWSFQFDTLTVCMLGVVLFISFFVHLYSLEYMGHDPHLIRFISYLSFFTFFMVLLVTGDNFIVMFLGWEGVGLCSYLLINFWYTRIQANKAAIKAMVVNRVGDLGFALGIFIVFLVFNSVNFSVIFALVPLLKFEYSYFFSFDLFGFDLFTLICLLLFVGSIGKSAQVGLHIWLPDAMEGPTPVSALIHAATMVTAGVFMVIRCSPLFEQSSVALLIVCVLGAVTAFFASTVGVVQNDLKKVIAYSTCSQLGYMVFSCGLSNYSVSMFHLMNHAYFKALLFLSAGSIIHALNDEQDMRLMGGVRQVLPFTYSVMMIGSLSLMGFPFLTGFYSKDVILEIAYVSYSITGSFAHWLGCISAFFTAFYSFRLLYLTFLRNTNVSYSIFLKASEPSIFISLPLFVLALGSIFIGYLTKDMVLGLGSPFWGNSLYIDPVHFNLIEAEFLPFLIKLIPVVFSLSGAFFAVFFYYCHFYFLYQVKLYSKFIYIFLNKKWFFDRFFNAYVAASFLRFGYGVSFSVIDKGLIEIFGPLGLVRRFKYLSLMVSGMQTGFVYHYAFFMFISLILIIGFFYLKLFIFNHLIIFSSAVVLFFIFVVSLILLIVGGLIWPFG